MPRIYDKALRQQLKPGRPITLILGAGVSRSRGVPLWSELLSETWKAVFGDDPYAADADLLERARSAGRRDGMPEAFLDRLDVRRHPFEIQFAFEAIFDRLRWAVRDKDTRANLGLRPPSKVRASRLESNEQRASELFTSLLRKILYRRQHCQARESKDSPDTLSLIAAAVRKSALAEPSQRLIDQVITFNVDDLLEREVNARSRRQTPLAQPIYRASAVRPLAGRGCIAIYHLHGFVPLRPEDYPHRMEDGYFNDAQPPAESLVFTDEQYWRTVGKPAGFASRIFTNALSGHCMFIGLSMTDLNIIRWLSTDAIERSDDFRTATAGWSEPAEAEQNLLEELLRHYWVTVGRPIDAPVSGDHLPEESFSVRVLRDTLARRGVEEIAIPSWDSGVFRAWWTARFLS